MQGGVTEAKKSKGEAYHMRFPLSYRLHRIPEREAGSTPVLSAENPHFVLFICADFEDVRTHPLRAS